MGKESLRRQQIHRRHGIDGNHHLAPGVEASPLDLEPGQSLVQGGELKLSGEIYSPDGRAPVVLIGIVRADGTPVYGVATDMDGVAPRRIAVDRFAFTLRLPRVELLPGQYFIRAHALDPEGVRLFDNVERELVITGATRELGLVRLEHRWDDEHPAAHGDGIRD